MVSKFAKILVSIGLSIFLLAFGILSFSKILTFDTDSPQKFCDDVGRCSFFIDYPAILSNVKKMAFLKQEAKLGDNSSLSLLLGAYSSSELTTNGQTEAAHWLGLAIARDHDLAAITVQSMCASHQFDLYQCTKFDAQILAIMKQKIPYPEQENNRSIHPE